VEPSEIEAFVRNGQSNMTAFAQAQEAMARWAASYEQRGGAAIFGDDATQIVYLSNDLVTWMTPERAATISRLRLDVG
jgi:hypothetical protein